MSHNEGLPDLEQPIFSAQEKNFLTYFFFISGKLCSLFTIVTIYGGLFIL